MSSAAATACTRTPRCRLRRTAASLNSALYSWTFFGPARGTRHLPLLGGSVYKSEAGSPVSFKRLLGCSNSACVCSGSARLGLVVPIPHAKQQIDQDRQPAKRIEEARKLAHESDHEAHSKPAGVPTQDRTKGGSIGVVLR